MRRFVLASASPRRKALLEALGLRIEVVPSGADEVDEGARPEAIVIANARLKRDEVARRLDGPAIVIAADTLVFLGDAVLSKPETLEEARAMLRRLAGRTHHVVTGLAIAGTGTGAAVEGHETTAVTFRDLTGGEVDHFVHAVKPFDRAGAYTADGPGSLLIARFEGCYQNVLGLPIPRLDSLLRELGVSLFEEMDAERSVFL